MRYQEARAFLHSRILEPQNFWWNWKLEDSHTSEDTDLPLGVKK